MTLRTQRQPNLDDIFRSRDFAVLSMRHRKRPTATRFTSEGTPQPAEHLVAFYMGCGYRPVESVKFQGKHYRSVVLSKGVAQHDITHAFVQPLLNPAVKGGRQRFPGIEPSA